MADWLQSMTQTFEYYTVDPGTWKDIEQLKTVKSCSITRDSTAETLGSASFSMTESVGECYIRVYMITIQNGVKERHPLGTFLVQTPSSSFDGKINTSTVDAYTPLLELKENPPPLGYFIPKQSNVMEWVHKLSSEHARAPVVGATNDTELSHDFVANTNDTWLTFISDLMYNAKYNLELDEMGRILFSPKQDTASLQPVWTYDDDNSSILHPEITLDRDLYGIPNVVEVVYSQSGEYITARVVNDDPNSPVSTVSRGREILHRVTDPDLNGMASEYQVKQYANQLLRELSTIEYKVSYTHGYCGTRLGDCIRLNYSRAGITDVKGKIISQSIKCEPGCPVSEKAVFTTKLWG